jgi:hypothetical protein
MKLRTRLTNIRFTTWLAIVSILGFATILVNSLSGVDIGPWVEGLLFMIIGFALFVMGGAKFFLYFRGGLTASEVARLVTVVIGVASFFTGVLMLPLFGVEVVVLNGIKAVIAVIAIAVIAIEELFGGKK